MKPLLNAPAENIVGIRSSRMGTEAAKLIYRLRGQTAEWVNAQARNRGFWFMPVRGQARCRTVALLFATTHNLVVGERRPLREGIPPIPHRLAAGFSIKMSPRSSVSPLFTVKSRRSFGPSAVPAVVRSAMR